MKISYGDISIEINFTEIIQAIKIQNLERELAALKASKNEPGTKQDPEKSTEKKSTSSQPSHHRPYWNQIREDILRDNFHKKGVDKIIEEKLLPFTKEELIKKAKEFGLIL